MYTTLCRIDDDTGIVCNRKPLSLDQVFVLVNGLASSLDALTEGYL